MQPLLRTALRRRYLSRSTQTYRCSSNLYDQFLSRPGHPPSTVPPVSPPQRRPISTEAAQLKLRKGPTPPRTWDPPAFCPGCGAPTQRVNDQLPGYYPLKPRKRHLETEEHLRTPSEANEVWEDALDRVKDDPELMRALGVDAMATPTWTQEPKKKKKIDPPHCDRCHGLIYSHRGPTLSSFPTLDTLSSLLLASPHKYHHIYHLVDAADFPLTLRTELRNHLYRTLPKKVLRYLTISYVITRCDVLLPKRAQIASLMTYLRTIIKDVLPAGEKVEGPGTSLHAISARSGWDLGQLKEEISRRRGEVLFLGAVNVGKSSLMREVWPKNSELKTTMGTFVRDAVEFDLLPDDDLSSTEWEVQECGIVKKDDPIGPEEDKEPVLEDILKNAWESHSKTPAAYIFPPTISDIPGTTAAPIRVTYKTAGRGGKYRGELVDLPGLDRWGVGDPSKGLLKYVNPSYQRSLVLTKRVDPEKFVLKQDQVLMIAGLIVIKPKGKYSNFVEINPFVRAPVHQTSWRKSHQILSLENPEDVTVIPPPFWQNPRALGIRVKGLTNEETKKRLKAGLPDVLPPFPTHIQKAGTFYLNDDVTVKRNPKIWQRSPEALAALPYKIVGTDILLDGLGWLEVTTQIRQGECENEAPAVEIWSPEGKGIGQRRSMSAFMLLEEGAQEAGLRKRTARPRISRKGAKKVAKVLRRRSKPSTKQSS